jgi:hypothetical protein
MRVLHLKVHRLAGERISVFKKYLLGFSLGALSCCPPSCVARGARVRTPRGLRLIEDLAVGDDIFAVNPDSGELVASIVSATRTAKRECVSLSLGNSKLVVTSDHPLYCPTTKTWAPAGDWILGKRTHVLQVTNQGSTPVRVGEVSSFAGIHDVYDLSVEHQFHNFVANDVLVHNKTPPRKFCDLPNQKQVESLRECSCPIGTTPTQGFVECNGAVGTCSGCSAPLSQDAGSDADAGTGAVIVGGCPRVILGNTLPSEFSGDTTGLPNIVTSQRLEWTDAPDDALEFTAPVAGNYVIDLVSSVPNLGASAQDYNTNGSDAFPFTRATCPAPNAVKMINGIFNQNQPTSPIALTAGQSIVIFVSAPSWANLKVGAYTLKVRKLP